MEGGDSKTRQESLEADCKLVQSLMLRYTEAHLTDDAAFRTVRISISHIVQIQWDDIECVDGVVRPIRKSHE